MKKKFLKGIRKAIGTKYILGIKKNHVLLYTCIFTSFGYFNKHYEEIYECGKKITFEDMSAGITFIFFIKTKLLKKYIKLFNIIKLKSINKVIWIKVFYFTNTKYKI